MKEKIEKNNTLSNSVKIDLAKKLVSKIDEDDDFSSLDNRQKGIVVKNASYIFKDREKKKIKNK